MSLKWNRCRLNELSSVLVSFNITVEETEGILKVSETEQERILQIDNYIIFKCSLLLYLVDNCQWQETLKNQSWNDINQNKDNHEEVKQNYVFCRSVIQYLRLEKQNIYIYIYIFVVTDRILKK